MRMQADTLKSLGLWIVGRVIWAVIGFVCGFCLIPGIWVHPWGEDRFLRLGLAVLLAVVFAFDGPKIWRWLEESRDRRRDRF